MITLESYGEVAIPHLQKLVAHNRDVLTELSDVLVKDVKAGGRLFVFGSGHSALFPLELYHRAGGANFVIPVVGDFLMPHMGPPIVRVLERTPGVAQALLARALPRKGEMLWMVSQSGINSAIVDLALFAKESGLKTVAFTSKTHSAAVASRHPSGKRLFEICDYTIDLKGERGDAAVTLPSSIKAGAISSLGSFFLGHSLLVEVSAKLEAAGHSCVYTSVNTPEGEARNKSLEAWASERDPLLIEKIK